jgi:hypothetical protein
MKKVILATGFALMLATPALAQSGTVTGAAGGAATGAVIGGPVGAAVGGVAGAVAGTILAPPPAEVRTYVTREEIPSTRIERQVVVGETLPDTVVVRRVPNYDSYGYAVVNQQRVIIDPRTHRVVEILR